MPDRLQHIIDRLAGYSPADAWQRPDAEPFADELNAIDTALSPLGYHVGGINERQRSATFVRDSDGAVLRIALVAPLRIATDDRPPSDQFPVAGPSVFDEPGESGPDDEFMFVAVGLTDTGLDGLPSKIY